jgi:hypothetical protein
MPSFSKECLGGFVGFQRIMTAPNIIFGSPNIFDSLAAESTSATPRQVGIEGDR